MSAVHAQEIGVLMGGSVVYRPEREAQVLTRLKSLNQGPLSDETVARLFREVMSACLALERPLTVAYLARKARSVRPRRSAIRPCGQHVACASIDEAFRRVEAGNADYVVAPVENSTEGAIGRTLDQNLRLFQTLSALC